MAASVPEVQVVLEVALVRKHCERRQQPQQNSYAEGKFLCESKEDPNQHVHLRVYMQIANQETEFEPIEERAKQAADRTVDTIHEEIQVLKLLTEKKSQHTPTLLGYKEEKQDNSGLVPGGYVCYLLWNLFDGIRLGTGSLINPPFWSLPRAERDEVRKGFEVAYKDLIEIGVMPLFSGLKHLIWNAQKKEIYIVGFKD
ncbi:hypothetical protein V8E54_014565 [Elaphomyces granulatus]